MPADICTHPWKYRVEPFRIIGNLYYVGNRDVSSHLIDTGDGLVLIDTGFPQTVYQLLESIRRLGFSPDDLHTILHNHGHYDHFGGTPALVELTGARTVMGEADLPYLTERTELTWAPEYGVPFYESFKVDLSLKGGEQITVGNTIFDCLHIPGHTPGGISYFFDVEEDGKSYRVGIHGAPGLNSLTDDYMQQYGLPLSLREDYMRSLRKLQQQKVDVFIGAHPGQNRTFQKQEARTPDNNPFIAPDDWGDFLSGWEKAAIKLFGLDVA